MQETAYKLNTQMRNIPAARLDASKVAEILGFGRSDITVLVVQKLLKPLGKPNHCATKYFSWQSVMECANDERWLSQATQALYQHWVGKNARTKRAKDTGITSLSV